MSSSGASSAGGGDLVKLATQVLAAPAATIDFSSIVGTYENLMLVLMGALSDAVGSGSVGLRFNADSGAHYLWVQQNGSFSAVTSSGSSNTLATSGRIGTLPGTNGGSAGTLQILVPNYKRTTILTKQAVSDGGLDNGASNTLTTTNYMEWVPAASAAITEITLIDLSGGNFITGTVATLYGMN